LTKAQIQLKKNAGQEKPILTTLRNLAFSYTAYSFKLTALIIGNIINNMIIIKPINDRMIGSWPNILFITSSS
jgi:hypothetical protein